MADKNKEPRIIIDGGRNANVKQSYDKLRLEAKINTILKIMLYFFSRKKYQRWPLRKPFEN